MLNNPDDESGWLGNLLLGHEGRQSRDIERLKRQTTTARQATADMTTTLQRRVARLEMVCETLVNVVLAHGIVDKDQLKLMMAQVDLRDGREDGALTAKEAPRSAPTCTNCGLPINPRRDACVYCDEPIVRGVRR